MTRGIDKSKVCFRLLGYVETQENIHRKRIRYGHECVKLSFVVTLVY